MITSTIQAMLDALCALNGWERHIITIGDDNSLNAAKAERDVKLKNAGANLTNQYFQREYGLLDGDVAEAQQQQSLPQPQQFNALPQRAFSFAADVKRFTPQQQDIEELSDTQPSMRLLSNEQVNEVLEQSASLEDVAFHLSKQIPDATQSEFSTNLDRALFQADVMGYVFAQQGK